jgi:hypothetical protein
VALALAITMSLAVLFGKRYQDSNRAPFPSVPTVGLAVSTLYSFLLGLNLF